MINNIIIIVTNIKYIISKYDDIISATFSNFVKPPNMQMQSVYIANSITVINIASIDLDSFSFSHIFEPPLKTTHNTQLHSQIESKARRAWQLPNISGNYP